MEDCASSFFEHDTGDEVGGWEAFGDKFAEMLVSFIAIVFKVVENLCELCLGCS